jgi:hypothetical protein
LQKKALRAGSTESLCTTNPSHIPETYVQNTKKYLRRTGEVIATIIPEHFQFSDPRRKTYTLNWRITILDVILKECGNFYSNLQKEEIEATLGTVR